MVAVTAKEERQLDSGSCCMCSPTTPSAPRSLSGLVSSFHGLPGPGLSFDTIPLLPVPLVFLVSVLITLHVI